MKALVFDSPGSYAHVLQYREVATPRLTDNQVRIVVKARPVNPSDHYFIQGVYRHKPVYPQIAGLTGSGIVTEVGPQVSTLQPGDPVAFRNKGGTWAEQIVLVAPDNKNLLVVPSALPPAVSAQLPLNGITAQALLVEAGLKAGDWLLVDAASSSLAGLLIQLAARRGIHVVALVRADKPAHTVENLGAEWVFRQDDPQLRQTIEKAIGQHRINCFLDAVGGPVLTECLPLLAPHGTIILYGNLSGGQAAQLTNPQLYYQHLLIKGFGIDHWLDNQSTALIDSLYTDLIDGLLTGQIQFTPSTAISFDQALPLPAHADKIILAS